MYQGMIFTLGEKEEAVVSGLFGSDKGYCKWAVKEKLRSIFGTDQLAMVSRGDGVYDVFEVFSPIARVRITET
jgi:hypothetical protein